MKKFAWVVVAVAIGVLAGFPLLTGIQLKKAFHQRVAAMPEQAGVSVHIESYERGWLQSTALMRVELDLQQLLGEPTFSDVPVSILVASEFDHGPVLMTDMGLRLGLGYGSLHFSGSSIEGVEQAMSEWLAATPMRIQTLIFFDQGAQTELSIEAYEADHGEDHIRFGGLTATMLTDGALTRYEGALVIRDSSVITTDLAVDLAESSGSMSYQGTNPFTMIGETVFRIPQLVITSKSLPVKLQELNLNGGTQLNQGKLDYFQTLEVGKLESPLPVTAARWHMEFAGLSPEGLEAWSDLSDDMQDYVEQAAALEEGEELPMPADLEEKVDMVLAEMLQPGLRFSQRLDVDALGENQNANMMLEYVGEPGGGSLDWEDPFAVIQTLKGELKVALDEQAVMNSPMVDTVMPLMQQGLLMPQDGKLVLEALLESGMLMLNGSPVPLEALLQSALAPPVEPGAEGEPGAPMAEPMP